MTQRHPGSFRDPAGFVFSRGGELLRQVNAAGREDYEALMSTGLADELHAAGLLVPHAEVDVPPAEPDIAWRVLRPEPVPFVTYPYEWCFGQLRDAALLTLDVQRRALARGVVLKDASAFNVQFVAGRPLLIDTLSFASYREGEPWAAYGQFCRHFLAPLALMARRDARLGVLTARFLDGVPLDLAASLLPRRAWLSPGLATHLLLHARSVRRWQDRAPARKGTISRRALDGFLASLQGTVRGLKLRVDRSHWTSYYREHNYGDAAFAAKERAVRDAVAAVAPRMVWDLGANTGAFSRAAAQAGALVVATDVDPLVVERLWADVAAAGETRVLPLVNDLANPSPALGWAGAERASFAARGPADLVLALALVHHLAIGNNVPLPRVADVMADLGRALLVEWVPKTDGQVRRLLATRLDIFPDYTEEGFRAAFAARFAEEERRELPGSERVLYRLRRRETAA